VRQILKLAACAALWASSLSAQGEGGGGGDSLYSAWCSRCHGADAHGTPAASTRLSVPPADLASCAASTPETEAQWIGVVTRGGAAYGLSLDMPAFGEEEGGGATREQIRQVVHYVRSLCRERGWPPGELNFPRTFLVEKAYPENELVLVAHGAEEQAIYERRAGRRFQFEAEVVALFDSLDRPFEGGSASLKYNAWHSLDRRALATLGVEVTPPLGRRDRWEVEPYVAGGIERARFDLQVQVVGSWEETEGVSGASYRVALGRRTGRFTPMVEAGWDVPRGAQSQLSLYPQLWFRLSRLGHVAGSIGAEVPARGVSPPRSRLIAFLLWDFGDAPLFHGW
jgi:mono/diheme cytochrome c family protein